MEMYCNWLDEFYQSALQIGRDAHKLKVSVIQSHCRIWRPDQPVVSHNKPRLQTISHWLQEGVGASFWISPPKLGKDLCAINGLCFTGFIAAHPFVNFIFPSRINLVLICVRFVAIQEIFCHGQSFSGRRRRRIHPFSNQCAHRRMSLRAPRDRICMCHSQRRKNFHLLDNLLQRNVVRQFPDRFEHCVFVGHCLGHVEPPNGSVTVNRKVVQKNSCSTRPLLLRHQRHHDQHREAQWNGHDARLVERRPRAAFIQTV